MAALQRPGVRGRSRRRRNGGNPRLADAADREGLLPRTPPRLIRDYAFFAKEPHWLPQMVTAAIIGFSRPKAGETTLAMGLAVRYWTSVNT
jgi:hypothetical protein